MIGIQSPTVDTRFGPSIVSLDGCCSESMNNIAVNASQKVITPMIMFFFRPAQNSRTVHGSDI